MARQCLIGDLTRAMSYSEPDYTDLIVQITPVSSAPLAPADLMQALYDTLVFFLQLSSMTESVMEIY